MNLENICSCAETKCVVDEHEIIVCESCLKEKAFQFYYDDKGEVTRIVDLNKGTDAKEIVRISVNTEFIVKLSEYALNEMLNAERLQYFPEAGGALREFSLGQLLSELNASHNHPFDAIWVVLR